LTPDWIRSRLPSSSSVDFDNIHEKAFIGLETMDSRDCKSTGLFVEALAHRSPEIRIPAMVALCQPRACRDLAVPMLIKCLGDPNEDVRWEALMTLAFIPNGGYPLQLDGDQKSVVRECLNDPSQRVRTAAFGLVGN